MAITNYYADYGTGNDYIGASFTDGAFTVADMTLTKTGAFTATKANHWLYLTDNGSGNVTAGYYKVSSVTSANAVVLAASPKSGATDPTDVKCTQATGAAALPFRSVQSAPDLITRNATDGDQVNVQSGTAQVLTASIPLATYGTPTVGAPFVLRGYTSSANDGGIAEIDCGGYPMMASNYSAVRYVDLKCHNFGDNNGLTTNLDCLIFRCEFYKGASSPSGKTMVSAGTGSKVVGCYVHDIGSGSAIGIGGVARSWLGFNYVVPGSSISTDPKGINISDNALALGNIVLWTYAGPGHGIYADNGCSALNNIAYSTVAATGNGITNWSGGANVFMNNIVCGWSGSGAKGIRLMSGNGMIGYNAFYNNTAQYQKGDVIAVDLTGLDIALAADPFTDAANGDFSLTAAGKAALRGLGFPASYLGAHASTDGHVTLGPIQYGEAEAAGGGGPLIGGRLVRG